MNMSTSNVPKSDDSNRSRLFLEQTERNVNDYIKHAKKSEWAYHFNRIFISPGHSFNGKYLIKFLLTKSVQPIKRTSSGTRVASSSSNNKRPTTTPPRQKRPKAASSRSPAKSNVVTKESNVDDLIGNEHEYDIRDILDRLNDKEWFRLLNIEPGKRMETINHHYHAFKRILDNISLEKLEKLHNNVQTEVPYVIYTEAAEDFSINTKYGCGYFVNTVDGHDVLGTLKTCGVVVIDVSRDVAALSKGWETFRAFKRELVNDMDKVLASNGRRLIVVISTVMTWTGVSKGHVMYERNVDDRAPSPQCADHYEFELEVLAVNKTKGLKEIVTTIVVWTGITYGFEQDLFRFAFDSAREKAHDHVFPIPKSRNYVPVIHVENLARLVHKIISENHKLKEHCVFAVETPTYTLRQIITAIGKTCDANNPIYVSSDVFLNKHKLQTAHKRMISMDVIVNPAVNRLWPDFEWYDGKPSIVHKMKSSLTGSYETGSNVKNNMKILVLGPPGSGKTELARRLAQRYGSVYLEPGEIVENHVDEIRTELMALREVHPRMYSYDSSDDVEDQTEQTEADTPSVEKMNTLDNDLQRLYTSVDANDETLDIHLIPLLKARMSHLASSKLGYVLDGYPNTAKQAKSIFGDTDSRRMDVDRLPDLTVCLTMRETQPRRTDANVDDVSGNASEAPDRKQAVFFSDVHTTYSRDFEMDNALVTTTPLTAKPMTKTSDVANGGTKTFAGKRGRPAWNADEHDMLLKMLNRHYVPTMTVDCSSPPDDHSDVDRADDSPDAILERRVNAVDEETRLLRGGKVSPSDDPTDMDETGSTVRGSNVERAGHGPRRLCEKMTLLDELEKISDFGHVDRLSTDEYLMRHVTPTLTKLLAQVARVRPKNAVEFLAYAAVAHNPEGSPECPERSEKGVRIQRLLERAVHVLGADDETLTGFLAVHSAGRDEQ